MSRSYKRHPFGKSWLSEEETVLGAQRYEELFDWAARREAEETPAIEMLINDVVMDDLMVLKLEEALWTWKEPGNDDKKTGRDKELALIEAYGRWQERRRRAMNELEEHIAQTGTPLALGLADKMKPILKKAEGVIEESIEFETRKRGKKPSEKQE